MTLREYDILYRSLIKNSKDLTPRQVYYFRVIKLIRKMKRQEFSKDKMEMLEDQVYTVNGKILSDKQRMIFELNRLVRRIESEDMVELDKLAYKVEILECNVKSDILELQCKYNIPSAYYSLMETFIENHMDEINVML